MAVIELYVSSYITLSNARYFTRQGESVGSQQSARVSSYKPLSFIALYFIILLCLTPDILLINCLALFT
jgi:hypothetical protein